MIIKTLYITIRDGKTTASLIKPDIPYTTSYRVIADEGKQITNGVDVCSVVDTDYPNDWEELEDATAEEILNILTGGDNK